MGKGHFYGASKECISFWVIMSGMGSSYMCGVQDYMVFSSTRLHAVDWTIIY